MAFCSKMGSLLNHTISANSVLRGQAPMLNAIRSVCCMSTKRLFVGGLPNEIDDKALKDAFSPFDVVDEAKVITDESTGRSKGYGFVRFKTYDRVYAAVHCMDGAELNGKKIRVETAKGPTLRKPLTDREKQWRYRKCY